MRAGPLGDLTQRGSDSATGHLQSFGTELTRRAVLRHHSDILEDLAQMGRLKTEVELHASANTHLQLSAKHMCPTRWFYAFVAFFFYVLIIIIKK